MEKCKINKVISSKTFYEQWIRDWNVSDTRNLLCNLEVTRQGGPTPQSYAASRRETGPPLAPRSANSRKQTPHNQCINNRLPMRPKTRKPPAVVRYFRKVFPRPSDETSAHPIYKRLCINSLKVNTTTHVTNINSEKPLLIIDRLTLLPKIIV